MQALTLPFHLWISAGLCGALASGGFVFGATSDLPEWRNAKGVRFRAQPVEALGPYALFSPEAKANRLLKFRTLNVDDCIRFYQAVAARPPRAARWADAQGALTRELLGRVQAVAAADRAAADVASLPEPELLLIYSHTSHAPPDETAAQDTILSNFEPFARRVRRIYPGRVEVVVAVARPGAKGPPPVSTVWMTADPERLAEVDLLRGFVPVVSSGLQLITREGVPIAGGAVRDLFTLAQILDHASELLWDINPDNPRTLLDRAHYQRAVRPVQFAQGTARPEMLANPLPVAMLRRQGVTQLDAELEIDAEGSVEQVTLRPASELPAVVAETLRETIRRSRVFAPAIEDGEPVTGTLHTSFALPPPDPQLAAEAAWIQGEARIRLPITSWLVLGPIRVDELVFTTVDRVGADGTVVLQPVTAGTAQFDSFHDDWFSHHRGGAASVLPVEGQEQEIGGEKLVWQRVTPVHSFVDLTRGAGNRDYCVGYAWTEVVSPVETNAWLGIGSDDGLKVWVNGRLVADSWTVRASRLDDEVVPVRLKAGKNQILVKVQNETGAWSFIARLRVQENGS